MSWSFNARGRRYTYTSVPAATVPASARFDVPARFQGQIITYAFAAAKPARDGAGVGDLLPAQRIAQAAAVKLAVIDGVPARGSGYCCKKALCGIGVRVHGPIPGPCPSLTFDGERHWCGEVQQAPSSQKAALIDELSIGAGCCSALNSDRQTMLQRRSSSSSPSSEP